MNYTSGYVTRTYYALMLLSTLAASFIWGINTLFLLDAGLSNAQAFGANAFFSLGQVAFEVPTGLVADTLGRRVSYALGAATLLLTTVAYFWLWQIQGPFWAWAVVSALLGLGFTFFSGATEAWLVDALHFTEFSGTLESVFARGQAVGGVAMLVGSVAGGLIAQATNLGVPYIVRAAVLFLTFILALVFMKDLGFTPEKGLTMRTHVSRTFSTALHSGWNNKPVRFMMLSSIFSGVGFYIFYAAQPYLLELYGNPEAYGVAGLAAAVIAGAQIVGGLTINHLRRLFRTRTSMMILATAVSTVAVFALGFVHSVFFAAVLLVLWGLVFSFVRPLQQAYLNGLIESRNRATVLSFDSLLSSSGGAAVQPALGKVADTYSYSSSFMVSALVQLGAVPLLLLARRTKAPSDVVS